MPSIVSRRAAGSISAEATNEVPDDDADGAWVATEVVGVARDGEVVVGSDAGGVTCSGRVPGPTGVVAVVLAVVPIVRRGRAGLGAAFWLAVLLHATRRPATTPTVTAVRKGTAS